jgi:YfiH family protein
MIVHSEPLLTIIFGDKRTAFVPRDYAETPNSILLLEKKPFLSFKKTGLQSLVFLHQTHSTQGLPITNFQQIENLKPFSYEGDYLLTQQIGIGLAIAAGDCLPIILYDKKNHAAALVHAGWRGSVAQIAPQAFERMNSLFGSLGSDMRVFFGPSAKRCCYRVGPEVIEKVDNFWFKDQVIFSIGSSILFDLPLFNRLLLEQNGIPSTAFNDAYNACTIHTTSFCSYRKTKTAHRQATIVCLR